MAELLDAEGANPYRAIAYRAAADTLGRLRTIPGIGPELARRLHESLGVQSLEALETAARAAAIGSSPRCTRTPPARTSSAACTTGWCSTAWTKTTPSASTPSSPPRAAPWPGDASCAAARRSAEPGTRRIDDVVALDRWGMDSGSRRRGGCEATSAGAHDLSQAELHWIVADGASAILSGAGVRLLALAGRDRPKAAVQKAL